MHPGDAGTDASPHRNSVSSADRHPFPIADAHADGHPPPHHYPLPNIDP